MERKIVVINEEKCTGCGLCARACHEGAIKMIEGKAHLISESYCDGLGDCLPIVLVMRLQLKLKMSHPMIMRQFLKIWKKE